MKEDATLIVLAGGESKRMGTPKHLLPTPWGMVLDRLHERLSLLFIETLVVGRSLAVGRESVRTVEDLYIARSPLVGICSGLWASRTDLAFVLACDMPFVKLELVQHLLANTVDVDVAVPVVRGHFEPLCAAYRKTSIPLIQEVLKRGILKVTSIYDHLQVHEIPETEVRHFDPGLSSFVNLNTPKELELLAHL